MKRMYRYFEMIGMPIPYRYYTITGYQKYMGQTDYQERDWQPRPDAGEIQAYDRLWRE